MDNSKYIISEFYDFSIDRQLIMEAEKENMPIIMTGILQKANTLNRNGRVYPLDILKREVEKYMQLVEENRAVGELDHPQDAIVSLSNVSHKVTEMWWQGETLYGKVQITETPSGEILKGLLKSGVMLGISSRGVGSVKKQGDKDIVQSDFELIAFDFVSSPSTPGAFLFKEGKSWGMTKLFDSKNGHNLSTIKEENENVSKLFRLREAEFWRKK